jgi:hypothetical protein
MAPTVLPRPSIHWGGVCTSEIFQPAANHFSDSCMGVRKRKSNFMAQQGSSSSVCIPLKKNKRIYMHWDIHCHVMGQLLLCRQRCCN